MTVKTKIETLKPLWIAFIVIFYASLSYLAWWHACLGSILIILFSYLAWPMEFVDRIGLRLRVTDVLSSLVLALLLLLGASVLISEITTSNKILVEPGDFQEYFHFLFYTLNEEMILGAILLNSIRRNYRKIHPVMISIVVAGIFAILHYVVYRWIFFGENARGILTLSTFVTLFAIGILRNNLILTTGHIGYTWALHFSWIAVMFGGTHLHLENFAKLTEAERFNLYLGSTWMLIIAVVLAGLSFFLYKKGYPSSITE